MCDYNPFHKENSRSTGLHWWNCQAGVPRGEAPRTPAASAGDMGEPWEGAASDLSSLILFHVRCQLTLLSWAFGTFWTLDFPLPGVAYNSQHKPSGMSQKPSPVATAVKNSHGSGRKHPARPGSVYPVFTGHT